MRRADVAVIGLGALGSACASHLSKRGLRVVGFDRFAPPHDFGSSGGGTRIFRRAYFEGAEYVPLAERAFTLWEELEREGGERLFERTGVLGVGPAASGLVRGSLESARRHSVPAEMLGEPDVAARWPYLRTHGGDAVWEPGGGVLLADSCIRAHLTSAEQAGAMLQFESAATECTPASVGTPALVRWRAETLEAEWLVVAAGSWVGAILADLPEVTIERQVQVWLRPLADVQGMPAVIWEYAPGRHVYAVPDVDGHGVKAAIHHEGERTTADGLERTVTSRDIERVRRLLRHWAPDLNGPLLDVKVCMYTNTPDGHFLVGRAPGGERTLIAGGGSGHAFKFASAIGEAIADMVCGVTPRVNVSLFDPRRFR